MVFLFFLFLCLLFPSSIFATPVVQITDFSSNSDTEWIQLTNTTNGNIDLNGWSLKDKANNNTSINICLSPNSNQIITNNSTWLNNTGGDTIYLYDTNQNLIDELSYITGVDKPQPSNTNTCVLPTSTPTPTLTPTITPTPTCTPTPDPTVTNPSSGINLTEFMPYSDPEWVEFYNSNDYPVKLISWKLEDKEGHTRNINSLDIGATSYTIFKYSPFFDNTNSEMVIIRDQNNNSIAQVSYDGGLRTLERSWISINGNWCQSSITKGYENVTSCLGLNSGTPTPTVNSTKYVADEEATASAIIEPKNESSFLSPSPSPEAAPTTTRLILGEATSSSNTTKKNYFPLILIISGGLLLTSPAIISKLKSKK